LTIVVLYLLYSWLERLSADSPYLALVYALFIPAGFIHLLGFLHFF
jgi:hypothetical protein